jgi:hypothetical protein
MIKLSSSGFRAIASERRGGGMRTPTVSRALVAAALCLAVIGCSATTATPTTAPSPAAPTPTPARATTTQGPYRLDFELPQTDWRTTDSITGTATLSFVGTGGVDFGSSGGGPFLFDFAELSGTRHVDGAMTADCKPYRLDAGKPMSSPIFKSGGYSGDAPPSDFNRSFLEDRLVHLPVGDWTITAVASFVEGADCHGASYNLKAAVTVHVTA